MKNMYLPQEITIKTPYKEVISRYTIPEVKPSIINSDHKSFPETLNVFQNNNLYEYKPKVILSGFIVGDPVAFTQTPVLPVHYPKFSPNKQNLKKQIVIRTSHGSINKSQLSASTYKNQQKVTLPQSRFQIDSVTQNKRKIISSIPLYDNSHTVRRQDYQKVLNQNIILRTENHKLLEQNKRLLMQNNKASIKQKIILDLENQIISLKKQLINSAEKSVNASLNSNYFEIEKKENFISQIKIQQFEQVFNKCLEKYRQSILEEQKLLVDRFRLECKNQELNAKKQKLSGSRKQNPLRMLSLYQKPQFIIKQNSNHPYHHEQRQKHWRKQK